MKTRNPDTALKAFHDKGGTLRTRDLIALGVHTDALYMLRDSGRRDLTAVVSTAWPKPAKPSIDLALVAARARVRPSV